MSEGLAYDSDEARALTASITALMAAKVYETSTVMAEKIGPFKNFERNNKPIEETPNNRVDGKPKGPKVEVFCTSCGNSTYTYGLGDCQVFCDPDFGSCGFLDPLGCSG